MFKSGKNIRGHQFVTAVLRIKGHIIPWGIRLYVKKEDCRLLGCDFRKTTQLTADLIEEFQPPEGVKVIVLFDSYYLCPTVVKACRKRQFHFVSTLKSNRNLFRNGRKLKTGIYSKNLFRRQPRYMANFFHQHNRIQALTWWCRPEPRFSYNSLQDPWSVLFLSHCRQPRLHAVWGKRRH